MPDNTTVAVIKACLYDPQINRTYAEMAAHYVTAVLPVRPRRPRDKAEVEQAVLIIERWLLAAYAIAPYRLAADDEPLRCGVCADHKRSDRDTEPDKLWWRNPRYPRAPNWCCRLAG